MLPPGAQVTGHTKAPSEGAIEAAQPPGRSLGEVTGADAQEETASAEGPSKSEMELRPLGGAGAQAEQAQPPAPPPPAARPPAEPTSPAPPPPGPPPAAKAPEPETPEPETPEPETPEPETPEPETPELETPELETAEPEEAASSASNMPSHGLSDEATVTSIDISEYTGDDDSIFRPIVREEPQAEDTRDLLQQRHRQKLEEARGPEISENTRLLRCLIAGLVIAVPIALLQFFVTGNTVTVLYTSISLGRGSGLFAALKYGIASGIILGFGVGALLTKFKQGPGLGFFVGLLVGLSLGNGFWGMIPGIITGIYAGKVATFGVRRAINV
jgi:hypothetical protein